MSFVHPTVSGQGLEHLAQMTLYSLKLLKEKTLVLLRDHIRSFNIKAGRVETFLFSCPILQKGTLRPEKEDNLPKAAEQISGQTRLEFRFLHFQDHGIPKGEYFESLSSNTVLQTVLCGHQGSRTR